MNGRNVQKLVQFVMEVLQSHQPHTLKPKVCQISSSFIKIDSFIFPSFANQKCLISQIASSGLKRTSPIVAHHRPAKIRPHYGNHINDSMLSPNENHRDLMSPEINSIRSEERAHIRPKHDDG